MKIPKLLGAALALFTMPAVAQNLTLYQPESKSAGSTAVVICPGGGYSHLGERGMVDALASEARAKSTDEGPKGRQMKFLNKF